MKKIVASSHAAPAIGPYSQAVCCQGFLFVSGMIPLQPDGTVVTGAISAQTTQVLENLKAVLAAGDRSLEDVVKTTIYLTDLSNFEEVNRVYGTYFAQAPPARSTVGVAALPKGVGIEIEAIAGCRR